MDQFSTGLTDSDICKKKITSAVSLGSIDSHIMRFRPICAITVTNSITWSASYSFQQRCLHPIASASSRPAQGSNLTSFRRSFVNTQSSGAPASTGTGTAAFFATNTWEPGEMSVNPKDKKLIVMCGPSGAGKSSLLKKLMAEFPEDFGFSISHTTRDPRPGEKNGVDYHYVKKEVFFESNLKLRLEI